MSLSLPAHVTGFDADQNAKLSGAEIVNPRSSTAIDRGLASISTRRVR